MEMNKIELTSADTIPQEGPSVDFIKAIADLLETDAEDILAEMGYTRNEEKETVSAF